MASCYIGRYYNTALLNDVWYHAVCTYNGNGTSAGCKVYLNAVQVDDATNEGNASSYIAMENLANPLEIGKYDSDYFDGEISNIKVWNKELTTSEIKDDYSGASVPFKYKGANQTASYTSDFTSGADSWANAGRATVTGNSDSVGGVDDTLKIIADATSGASHYARRNSATATRRAYRIKFDYYIPSGQTVDGFQFGLQTTLNQFSTTGSWQTNVSFEVNDLSSGDLFLYLTDGGSQTVAGNAENEYVALKNITVVPIGAVAEYDGSGIASDKWFDKSGNDLHGTVSGSTVENAPSDSSGLVYEEGTFTPTITGITSVGYASQSGFYTRIGNMVSFNAYIETNSGTLASANVEIQDLPFTSNSTTQNRGGAFITYKNNFEEDGSSGHFLFVNPNTTTIEIYRDNGTRFIGTYMDSSSISLRINGFYYV